MSSYKLKAKNRKTGEIKDFNAYDDYFGKHEYGYGDEKGVYDEKAFNELFVICSPKKGFSDFLNNATPEEKIKLFTEVAHKANEDQRKTMREEELKQAFEAGRKSVLDELNEETKKFLQGFAYKKQ